ncbi:MAG: hypothetical protein K1X75_02260 [Leptospirales bacterium]|nr:hypothetical protein [Leptospirales bacterium]
MSAWYLLPFSLAFAGALLILFWPLLRPLKAAALPGSLARDAIQERMLLENLRDLRIEREHGKLSDQEYQQLAEPAAQALGALRQSRIKAPPAAIQGRGLRRHRRGWFCPHCAMSNRSEDQLCLRCGLAPEGPA